MTITLRKKFNDFALTTGSQVNNTEFYNTIGVITNWCIKPKLHFTYVFYFWASAPHQMQLSAGQTHPQLFSAIFELYHKSETSAHQQQFTATHLIPFFCPCYNQI